MCHKRAACGLHVMYAVAYVSPVCFIKIEGSVYKLYTSPVVEPKKQNIFVKFLTYTTCSRS